MTKYATIHVFTKGNRYSTETCIVYSEAELRERLAFYRKRGYRCEIH